MAEKNVVSWNVMLNGYVKVGDVELTQELFEEIPMKENNAVAWINPNITLELFHEVLASGRQPDQINAKCFLCIAWLGMMNEGRWVHECVHNICISFNENLGPAIIDMYV
ncbi:hypothetical protein V6N13_114083 [Hibiscus sabdariffa]